MGLQPAGVDDKGVIGQRGVMQDKRKVRRGGITQKPVPYQGFRRTGKNSGLIWLHPE